MPLYPGDTAGPHLERLNGGPNGTTEETEGIYNGYRFFDKEGITPLFPFGYGLSYTSFGYSGLRVTRTSDGGLDVSARVTNTGRDRGQQPSPRCTWARRTTSRRASSSPCGSCPPTIGSRCGPASPPR